MAIKRPLPLILLALLAAPLHAQVLPDGRLDYGEAGLDIPPATIINSTTPRTVQMLEDAMRGAVPSRRAQLVVEIGMCQLPQSVEPIRRAMADEAAIVRAAAADAAALLKEAALRDDLARLLQDEDPQVRRSATLAFATVDGGESSPSPAVSHALRDMQPPILVAAMRAVFTPEDAALVAASLDEFEPGVRAEAHRALARAGASEFVDAIARDLQAEVPLSAAAIEALGDLQARGHAEAVLANLNHPHPTVRRTSVDALHGLAEPAEQQSIALRMIEDPDPTVRQAAVEVLGRLPLTRAVAPLVRQLDDPYEPLFRAARAALLADGGEQYRQEVIAASVALLSHANPRRREDGSYLLGQFLSNAGMEQHLALLVLPDREFSNTDWAVLRQAVESLSRIGDERAVEPIGALVPLWRAGTHYYSDDPRVGTGAAAAEAVLVAAARLGYEAAIPEYEQIIRGDPEMVNSSYRAASLWGIGMLAQPSPQFISQCLSIYNSTSPFEGPMAKFEAIKALGNQQASGAAGRLAAIRDREQDPQFRWIAHWAHERATGVQRPYSPPERLRSAPVSIIDLEPRLAR